MRLMAHVALCADIWDGYGSYDPDIQECSVFQVGKRGGRPRHRMLVS